MSTLVSKVFSSNDNDAFTNYTKGYPDIQSNFTSWLNDNSNVHWGDYVRYHSDLESAFLTAKAANPALTMWDWGYNHYQNYGKNESRTLPKVVNNPGDLNNNGTDRDDMSTVLVSQLDGSMNHAASDKSVLGAFGQYHFQLPVVQTNEDRIVPGYGPKIYIDANGALKRTDGMATSLGRYRFDQGLNVVSSYGIGNYLGMRNALTNTFGGVGSPLYNEFVNGGSFDNIKTYYKAKVPVWDGATLGAQPPAGAFDANYYAGINPNAVQQWNTAVEQDNLDITARYASKDAYLLQDYTNVGRHAGYRGNAAIDPSRATGYAETLTEYERQIYRDDVLGITGAPGAETIDLGYPQYDEEGNLINPDDVNTVLEKTLATAISGDDLRREAQLGSLAQDVLKTTIDELRIAKQKESDLALMTGLPGYNEIINMNTTLANSILGDSGIGGVLSITGGDKEFRKTLEGELAQLTGMSNNSTLYNWQKWFDDTLLKRYENYNFVAKTYTDEQIKAFQDQAKQEVDAYKQAITAGQQVEKPLYMQLIEQQQQNGNTLDINNIEDFKQLVNLADVNAQKEFMTSFINDYIKPRFAQSKSIDEFVSYLDVKENEQNVFQSQTTINKLKEIAQLRAKSFLDLLKLSENTTRNFDATFYYDPISQLQKTGETASAAKLAQYEIQKNTVAQDFKNAKNNTPGADGINWAVEAYRYGYESTYKTDPNVFARLHYQVKGGTGVVKDANGNAFIFDPAKDILPYEELQQKIKSFGADLVARKEFYGDTSFMQFVTPEEYADALLSSIDPEANKEEWQKVVESLGLDADTASLQQVKDFLVDSLRTEQAKQIRESIKYLNETQQDLTQSRLGVSYIERPEDKTTTTTNQTVLYSIFKNAGYGGTEDEFYTDFMPDIDRSEQELISKTASDKGLTLDIADFTDPFSAFTKTSSLLGEDTDLTGQTSDEEKTTTSAEDTYFKLFGDDTEEDVPQKSDAAESFLSEFTSMFSGFQ